MKGRESDWAAQIVRDHNKGADAWAKKGARGDGEEEKVRRHGGERYVRVDNRGRQKGKEEVPRSIQRMGERGGPGEGQQREGSGQQNGNWSSLQWLAHTNGRATRALQDP